MASDMLDKQTDAMKEYCAISRSEGSLDRMKSLPPVLWLCSRGAAGPACFEHEDKNSDETPLDAQFFSIHNYLSLWRPLEGRKIRLAQGIDHTKRWRPLVPTRSPRLFVGKFAVAGDQKTQKRD
jgi:hypothetical protein